MSVPFDYAVTANTNGYQLRTVNDLRDILDECRAEAQQNLDVELAVKANRAIESLDLLVKMVPGARFALWRPDEVFITVSATLESLRAEFPWLKREKVTK